MLIFCTINIKNSPKTARKATFAFKHGAFFHFGGWVNDIRFPRSPKGVLHPIETISIIYSILLKKSLFEYWQKINFFNFFRLFIRILVRIYEVSNEIDVFLGLILHSEIP